MPEQQNPDRGPGRPVGHRTHGHRTATPDAPQLPRQRPVPPSRPPVNATPPQGRPATPRQTPPGGVPATGRPGHGERPTRVMPGPGTPDVGNARPAAGPPPGGNGPTGPRRGSSGGGSGGSGSGGSGAGGAATTAEKPPELGFNKIVAGAGAAVVTAVLGSFLGAIGTILGAAIGSIITTVATTLFQRSLDRGKAQVAGTSQKLRERRQTTRARGAAAWQEAAADGGTGVAGPGSQETVRIDPAAVGGTVSAPPTGRRRWTLRRLSRRSLIVSAVAAVLAFGLAMFLVTGIEWVKGSTITGGGSGTSIGNVVSGTPTQRDDNSDTGTSTSESTTSTSESDPTSTGSATPSDEQDGSSSSTSTSNPLEGGLDRLLPSSGNESGQRQSGQDNSNSGGGANSSN